MAGKRNDETSPLKCDETTLLNKTPSMSNRKDKLLDLRHQTPDDPFTMKQRADLTNYKRFN